MKTEFVTNLKRQADTKIIAKILERIARGELAIQKGRTFSHTLAKKKMKRWFK